MRSNCKLRIKMSRVKNGNLITQKRENLRRWQLHCDELLHGEEEEKEYETTKTPDVEEKI
jgi:hypothetical protein